MFDTDFSTVCEKCPTTSKLSWNNTVTHIHAMFPDHKKIFRHPNTHYITRFVCRHKRSSVFNNAFHVLRALSYRDSTNSVSRKITFNYFIYTNLTVFLINTTLDNTKESLLWFYPRFDTTIKPAVSSCN